MLGGKIGPARAQDRKERIFMAKKDKRFIMTLNEATLLTNSQIWVDRETGVNYLWHNDGSAGGLTPLLRADGMPVVTPIRDLPED